MIELSRLSITTIPKAQLLPGIHALRAVAALTILLFHLRYMVDILPPLALQPTVGGHFFTGVILFFVLSAFSLAFSTTPTMSRKTWVRDYLLKRFFRIAPLFYCMLAVYLVLFIIKGWSIPDAATWVMNFAFLFNFFPGKHEGIVWASWTIGVEVLFYVIFPLFLLIPIKRAALAIVLVAGIAISIFARNFIDHAGLSGDYGKFAFVSSLGVFLTGFVSYGIFNFTKKQIETGHWRVDTVKLVCASFSVACLIALFAPFGFTATSPGRPDLMVWGLLYGAIAIWQAMFPSPWFATRPMQWIGERSYGIYLLHPLVIGVLGPWLRIMYNILQNKVGNWAFFAVGGVTIIIVMVAANVAYHLIEKPGMAAGKRLLSYLCAKTAAAKLPSVS